MDTDFLIYALSQAGPERNRLRRAIESDAVLQISAVAWYEFSRGPRLPAILLTRNARDFAGIPDLQLEAVS